MSRCWKEGEWRAFLDSELAPAEMEEARAHLESCAPCAGLLGEVEARAHRVGSLIGMLDRIPERPATPRRAVTGRRRAAMVVLALAAALALAFVLQPRRTPVPRPAPSPVPAPLAQAIQPPAAVAKPRAPVRRAASKPRVDYYLGLDSEPIETGVVLRVALEDGLLADVIVDEQGRPRAVRPVDYEEIRR